MKGKTTLKLCNERVRDHAIGLIEKIPLDPPWTVEIKPWKKDRSAAQNRLSFLHYSQIAEQMFESKAETRARCKLDYGVPILLAENESFAEMWNTVAAPHGREMQLKIVATMRVTSLMKVNQFAQYIKEYMLEHEMNGVFLSHPKDLYYEAMGLKR